MHYPSPKLELNHLITDLLGSPNVEVRKKILNRIAAISNIQVTVWKKVLKEVLTSLFAQQFGSGLLLKIAAGAGHQNGENKPALINAADVKKVEDDDHIQHTLQLLSAELLQLENEMADVEKEMQEIEQQIHRLGKQPPLVPHPQPAAAEDAEEPAVGMQEVVHRTPDSIFDSVNAVTKQPAMEQAMANLVQKQMALTQRMQHMVAKMILIQSAIGHLTAHMHPQNDQIQSSVRHAFAPTCGNPDMPKPLLSTLRIR